jgi:predicted DCC family thiol-disulfide oxidoreductase YuxK
MNIVLFDGVCNLCDNTVLLLIKYDKNNQLHFAAQQTNAGIKIMNQHAINANNSSVIFIKNETVYEKSDAIIEIAKFLTGWPSILKVGNFIPLNIRNWIYDVIAKYRYKIFGKKKECKIPAKEHMHKFIY